MKIIFLSIATLLSTFAFSLDVKQIFVETNYAKLFCRVIGKGSPLIVIHGGPGLSQEYLLPQMSQLAKNHLVIFYDQRGSGRSEGGNDPAFIQLESFVNDLEALRKHFGFEKVTIMGHSWGGFLGMQYAIAHPESIEKLVLLNSIPASSEEFGLFGDEWTRRMRPYMDELRKIENSFEFAAGDPETWATYFKIIFRNYCASPQKTEDLSLRVSSQANLNYTSISTAFRHSVFSKHFDLHDDLKKLSCRALILHGDQDPIPVSTAENLHKSIKNSTFVVLKDCGHFPYVEKPQEFFAAIEEFLRK